MDHHSNGGKCEREVPHFEPVERFDGISPDGRYQELLGTARRDVAKIVATFPSGSSMIIRTHSAPRYHGRYHGHIRFYGAFHRGRTEPKTIYGYNAHGKRLPYKPAPF